MFLIICLLKNLRSFRKKLVLNKNIKIIPKGKNIYLSNSCLNPFDSNKYINHNKEFSSNSRFRETFNAIESIRKIDKNSYILFIENSKIDLDKEIEIKKNVDIYINIRKFQSVKESRKSNNKGVPALVTIIFGLELLSVINKFRNNFNIIPSRYKISANLFTTIKEKGVYLKFDSKNFIHLTQRMVFVKRDIYKFRLLVLLFLCCSNISLENIIGLFLSPIKRISYLGIEGYINGKNYSHE